MGTKTSPIYSVPSDEFRQILDTSCTIDETLRRMGSCLGGGNHRTLYKRCEEEGIDLSELAKRRSARRKEMCSATSSRDTIPLDQILVEKSTYYRNHLKRRLLREGILDEVCSKCGIGPEWNGERLALVLDHINGVRDDNRIENLRILCPNCHSQTDTYGGRQNRVERKCLDCGCDIAIGSTRCNSCAGKIKPRKVTNPPGEEALREMLRTKSLVKIGEDYGISEAAVRKWCKKYHLPTGKRSSSIEE